MLSIVTHTIITVKYKSIYNALGGERGCNILPLFSEVSEIHGGKVNGNGMYIM